MSKAVEFFKQVTEDSALKSAVKAAIEKAATKDEEVQGVAKIAKEAGFDVSAGDLKAFVASALKQSGELSDSEMENVAGGVVVTVMPGGNDAEVVDAMGDASDSVDNAIKDGVSAGAGAVASFVSGW